MSSDYLFAQPSFFRGFGRVFDPFGVPEPYNWSRKPQEADAISMAVDWSLVGKDLVNAFDHFSASDPNQLSLFSEVTEQLDGAEESR